MSEINLDEAPVAASGELSSEVPIIDLSADHETVVEKIGKACREWGFFQIVGHGVDPSLIEATMDRTRAFFALPKADKRALSRSRDNPWGFYDRELTKNVRDKKEVFDIGPDAPGVAASSDPFAGQTPWPDAASDFELMMRRYFKEAVGVSDRLMEMISLSLGARPGDMASAFKPEHTSFLRLNYYPVADPLAGEAEGGADLGIHHHTDAGALTLLLQDGVSGLQVYREGFWHNIQPVDGAFVINIGDMVQVWSNDLYRAPVHRVLAMDRADRYSIPFFYNPAYETIVAPLGGSPYYSGIKWGEFRRLRADGDYDNYGAEVQIGNYRI
jgi:isopenicillin N synthase-like dioxygenase